MTGYFEGRAALLAPLLVGACLVTGCASKSATPARQAEGVPVVVATVSQRTVPVDIQVIGNVEAYATIGVKSQVNGELTVAHFREGDFVKKGDVLFTIDQRMLEAQVKQAQATLARDKAQLNLAQANLARDTAQEKYARDQAARYRNLFQKGVISREQFDQYQTGSDVQTEAVHADKAAVESSQAAVAADGAALRNIEVQLSYTEIRSPIDGRTGNVMIKQGNVVKANDVDLVTINQLQPIYVTFTVPEARLPEIKRYMAQGKVRVLASPPDSGEVETGDLTFIDNAVDMTTGTIKLKGTFANSNRKLWPGQFVQVTLRLGASRDALLVPLEAVQNGQDGQFVFVVKHDMTVDARPVVAGARVEKDQVIEQGLRPGETVVTEGQLRLAPGVRVKVQDARRRTG
ncbi:MAG TPA: efflux RND transporter periplasmic adaptor subunit [Bryobacteraceae bacterium]|nr:efflux RND transporter periplasmic adaptor subunit [Bryobacteraceae bacterium]